MSVKNIARNLFLSGALVLSGGVVCSKPVLADCESGLKLAMEQNEKGSRLADKYLKMLNRRTNQYECLLDYASCLLDSSFVSMALEDADSLTCVSEPHRLICLNHFNRCREKITK